MKRFLLWLTARLPYRSICGDHGEPYLDRYSFCGLFGWRAYIHHFLASDPDRGLHDHPWAWSFSLILVGGYREVRFVEPVRILRPGSINVIRGTDFHRILLTSGQDAWTLFVHGPRVKGWGFWREGNYTPFSVDANDYSFNEWWKTAPLGKERKL